MIQFLTQQQLTYRSRLGTRNSITILLDKYSAYMEQARNHEHHSPEWEHYRELADGVVSDFMYVVEPLRLEEVMQHLRINGDREIFIVRAPLDATAYLLNEAGVQDPKERGVLGKAIRAMIDRFATRK